MDAEPPSEKSAQEGEPQRGAASGSPATAFAPDQDLRSEAELPAQQVSENMLSRVHEALQCTHEQQAADSPDVVLVMQSMSVMTPVVLQHLWSVTHTHVTQL